MILQLIFIVIVGYVYFVDAKKRCLPPLKWSFLAVLIYIFSTLTVATVVKEILRAIEFSPVGIIALFIGLIECVLSLAPLAFLNTAMKKRGWKKEEAS